MLRFAVPVLTLQPPVLQNNRKVPEASYNRRGSLPNLRRPSDISRPKACYLLNFAKNSLFFGGDQFAHDCAHHHPVLQNRKSPGRLKTSRSVGISAHFILSFRSLVTFAVSRADFGVPSPHPKIPFPRSGLRQTCAVATENNSGRGNVKNVLRAGPRLLRIQSERLELPAPFGWRIAQPFDADTARQPTFDRCLNEVRCKES
jgi:hypothetical protein